MARSSLDKGQDSDGSPAQDRRGAVTMFMNRPAGESGRTGDVADRASQLSETMSMLTSIAEEAAEAVEPTIEEYMAALLARTNQSSTSPAETVPRLAKPTLEKVGLSAPPQPTSPQAAPSASVTAVPTAVPECRDAFSELRELANISARSSFNSHLAQHLVLEMHGKRFVAVAAILASLVLLSMATSVQSLAYLAAVVAGTAACVWSVKYLSLGRALARVCAEADSDERTDD